MPPWDNKRLPLVDRFWARVVKTEKCWLWRGSTSGKAGYGELYVSHEAGKNRRVYAHRFSYELANGPTIGRLFVLHRCDTPLCVNPAHLFLGTQAVNMNDMKVKGRARGGAQFAARSHCKNGHAFGANPKRRKDGSRYCYECDRTKPSRRLRRVGA